MHFNLSILFKQIKIWSNVRDLPFCLKLFFVKSIEVDCISMSYFQDGFLFFFGGGGGGGVSKSKFKFSLIYF